MVVAEKVADRVLDHLLTTTCREALPGLMLEAVGQGTKMADHLSPTVRSAFPS